MRLRIFATSLATLWLAATPAAAKDEPPTLARCERSLGTIALIEGDAAGWTGWNLGSPRQLVNVLATESGCFTPHNPAGGAAADFLVTLVAGSQEEVDQAIETASGVAKQALVSSGAAGAVVGRVPFGGAAFGLLGGLGGKKQSYSAGIRVVSPASGMTVASGIGTVTKSSLSFRGSNWASNAASAAGYATSKEGQRLTEAFVIAFNNLIAQRAAIEAAAARAAPQPAAQSQASGASVAVDTVLRSAPSAEADPLRNLRAGTELKPTGRREGLFIETTDNYGTTGWVSVEDLR